MAEASGGGVNRSNWIGIEKGRLGTTGMKSMTGVATAFGVSVSDMRAYLDGAFGPPSLANAQKFLASRSTPGVGEVFDRAFVALSYSNPAKAAAYCLAALELRKPGGIAFHHPELLTQKHAENLIRLHVGESLDEEGE
jgi:hypothetical protein